LKTLYAKDAKGQMRFWSVEELDYGIKMMHGVMGGAEQEKIESVDEGLQTRTIEEQIHSRAESRLNKKIDSGYCTTIAEAETMPRTNSMGLKKPMLAAKFDTVKNINYDDLYYQHKYDGNRLLIKNEGGINTAYSRNGKPVETIPEIVESIIIPEGMTIDGEIYCHGQSLQTIVSWVKRRQENSLKLRFHAYDLMEEIPYEERLAILMQMEFGFSAELVPTYKFDDTFSIKSLLDQSITNGYEGLILRQNDFGYEDGKRSKSLIKVKKFLDSEFQITGMHLSKDGLPMVDFDTDRGTVGKATAPGSMGQKMDYYARRGDLLGKWVHLEYSQWTKDDKPFHPTALAILNSKTQLK
jgi:ATP-dependent DNA ligase